MTDLPMPSRRALLGRSSAAVALAALPVAALARSAHPDAELLRLGRALEAELVMLDAYEALPAGECPDERTDAVMAPAYAIVDRIGAIPARTLDGLLVQARAVNWCRDGESFDEDELEPWTPSGVTTDLRIALAIVRRLVVMDNSARMGRA